MIAGGPWPIWKGEKNMERIEAVMLGGPRDLSSVPRNVPSLSPGDDTAAMRVALRARLLLEKSLSRAEIAGYRMCGPHFFDGLVCARAAQLGEPRRA